MAGLFLSLLCFGRQIHQRSWGPLHCKGLLLIEDCCERTIDFLLYVPQSNKLKAAVILATVYHICYIWVHHSHCGPKCHSRVLQNAHSSKVLQNAHSQCAPECPFLRCSRMPNFAQSQCAQEHHSQCASEHSFLMCSKTLILNVLQNAHSQCAQERHSQCAPECPFLKCSRTPIFNVLGKKLGSSEIILEYSCSSMN